MADDALADFLKEIEDVGPVADEEVPSTNAAAPAQATDAAAHAPAPATAAADAKPEGPQLAPAPALAPASIKPVGPIAIAPGVFKFDDDEDEASLVPGLPPPAKRPKLATAVVPRALLTKAAPASAPLPAPRVLALGVAASAARPVPSGGAGPVYPPAAPPPHFTGLPVSSTPAAAVPADPTAIDRKTAAAMGLLRTCAGETWVDPTLAEWPQNDFRLFIGDLGNDVTDEVLATAFRSRFPSFAKARVVRDHRDGKTRGFGFVSVLEASDALAALKTMGGVYVGSCPITIRRANVTEKDYSAVVKREKAAAAAAAGAGPAAEAAVSVFDLRDVAKHAGRDPKLRH